MSLLAIHRLAAHSTVSPPDRVCASDLATALEGVLQFVTDPDTIRDCEADARLREERGLAFLRADALVTRYRRENS